MDSYPSPYRPVFGRSSSDRNGSPRLRQDYVCYPAGDFSVSLIPFALCNAQATFQRLMNVAMSGMDTMICLVYLDDIIVHSRNLSAQLDRLRLFFDCSTGLKLKVSKCRLLRTEVGFLGHRISTQGLAPDPGIIKAVRK